MQVFDRAVEPLNAVSSVIANPGSLGDTEPRFGANARRIGQPPPASDGRRGAQRAGAAAQYRRRLVYDPRHAIELSRERRMQAIRIDRSKPLGEEPHLGRNRYHPDIEPIAEIGEGEEIALETRDSLD